MFFIAYEPFEGRVLDMWTRNQLVVENFLSWSGGWGGIQYIPMAGATRLHVVA